ncbi:DUF5655 domain-containing protein [Corynebacterium sp. YIM 101645]|uniref:DUF5655 domain-containing protein n=1 Tax=Corynebacterium lemuris TaxID=1859292 RepID=A0ABT2FV97_9CORY|nr:DUF5655 domain-containing protein [Corynebacterium lemuris]MCS5479142.1 DUF5655 domain-containing protein [Corynebacterium lemuris]
MHPTEEDLSGFFGTHDTERHLYDVFAGRILEEFPDTRVKVHRTQISFYHRRLFAATWLPVRLVRGRPEAYLVVTFVLDRQLDSPRIVESVEPRPGRWTHHVLLAAPEEIDDELLGWVGQARQLAASG